MLKLLYEVFDARKQFNNHMGSYLSFCFYKLDKSSNDKRIPVNMKNLQQSKPKRENVPGRKRTDNIPHFEINRI